MERLHAVESYGEFEILDGELCRDGVPFRETIKRGVEYRASLGSPSKKGKEFWENSEGGII